MTGLQAGYIGQMVSLFDFLNKPAGSILGKQVAEAAVKHGVKIENRYVETRTYQGKIKLYPRDFLEDYFGTYWSERKIK